MDVHNATFWLVLVTFILVVGHLVGLIPGA